MATISVLTRGNAVWSAAFVGRPGLAGLADANRGRFALWLPVWFGIGIGLYFALPVEPAVWPALCGFALFGLAAVFLHRARGAVFFALLIAATVTAGFAAAQLRTDFVSASVLEREIGPVSITARVLKVEPTGKGVRLTLDRLSVQRRDFGTPPDRIRLSVRSTKTQPLPGDLVSALAILRPPSPPSLPGGFDFARKAWFERIGAVGFSLGGVTIVERSTGGGWRIWLARLRLDLTQRILDGAGDRIGPVAAALMTGERRAIPETALAAMRDSGLAHLLAISGLHIGLVAGLLFFVVRLGLAAIEPVALRYPIKKIAAGSAILGAFAYLSISGATIPTQRAFLMVSIVMLAVMIDRTAISMRLVAIAAMAVLLLAPESLLSASFQMSFAAVVALVAVYEAATPALARVRQGGGILGSRIGLFIAATLLTTLVASLATAPFAVYHFNRIALYGLLANAIAVPVMAMWIMPFALVSLVLMPFGLESLGLVPMGWGIEIVLLVAEKVASLPGAVAHIPPMPAIGISILALGGLVLCMTRGKLRFAGIPLVAAGMASVFAVVMPDILINRDGSLVAVNLGQGTIVMSPGKGKSFERDMWRRRLAVSEAPQWPGAGIGYGGRIGCDPSGCIVRFGAKTVALVADPATAAEDCGRADHVVLLTRLPRWMCGGSKVLVSTFSIWRDGAHAIRLTPDGPVVTNSRTLRGDRPWSRVSAQKRQYLRTSPTSLP